jgi:hypothetical protein
MERSSDKIMGGAKGPILLKLTDVQIELEKFKQANRQPSEAKFVELLLKLLGLNSEPKFEKPLLERCAKFIGHLLNYSGTVKGDAVSPKSPAYQLEGWTQDSFLYMHMQSLLALYLKSSVNSFNPDNPDKSHLMMLKELWIGVNAYRVLRGYDDLLSSNDLLTPRDELEAKGEISDKAISEAIKPWVKQLVFEIRIQCKAGWSVCFPCGTQDHAVYLELYGLDSGKLGLCINNLTGERKLRDLHAHGGGGSHKQAKPFMVGKVDLNQDKALEALETYLTGLIQCRLTLNWKDKEHNPRVHKFIYENAKSLESSQKDKVDWPQQSCQTVGNCVFLNYALGIKYRLYAETAPTGQSSLSNWLFDFQLLWVKHLRDEVSRPNSCFESFLRARTEGLMVFGQIGAVEEKKDDTPITSSQRNQSVLDTVPYINEIVVICADKKEDISVPGGYTRIPVDLNTDVGGKYIFFCYSTQRPGSNCGECISDIQFIYGKDTPTPPGYKRDSFDLNSGANGDYIYLCYKLEKYDVSKAITKLEVITSDKENANPPEGFFKIKSDLNKGAGGRYIFLCHQKRSRSSVCSSVLDTVPYINEIVVICADKKEDISVPGGYTRIPVDLNTDVGGKYIFFCYSTQRPGPNCDECISDIQFIYGKDTPTPPGYKRDSFDLNSGANGDYIYLCYKLEKYDVSKAITKLEVITSDKENANPPEGFVKIKSDLNKGAGGVYIFLCHQKRSRSSVPSLGASTSRIFKPQVDHQSGGHGTCAVVDGECLIM